MQSPDLTAEFRVRKERRVGENKREKGEEKEEKKVAYE